MGASLFLMPFFLYSIILEPLATWALPKVWLSVLGVGLICTAFAYILYFRLIADIGPLRALTVTFLIPLFGVLWGYFILGEKISEGFVVGGMLVCLAVWMVLSPQKMKAIVSNESIK